MKRRLLLIAAAVLPAVFGCSGLRPADGSRVTEGRFSASVEADGTRESQSGRFSLTTGGGASVLDIGHPLAGTLARLTVTPEGSVLETSSGKRSEGTSAELLMQRELGFALPVTVFERWLEEADAADRLESGDWSAAVLRRDGRGRPALLRIKRAGGDFSPSVRVTVSVDRRSDD